MKRSTIVRASHPCRDTRGWAWLPMHLHGGIHARFLERDQRAGDGGLRVASIRDAP